MEAARAASGYSLNELTVLSGKRDPFRLSTPAFHRDGAWLANLIDEHVGPDGSVHLRGFHYIAMSAEVAKPNGQRYRNTHGDWVWLQDHPAKAARWLGYVPFSRIVDERNARPFVRPVYGEAPEARIATGAYLEDAVTVEGILPRPSASGFTGAQPYRLVVWGEKSSLAPVLDPLAARYGADLYLGAGEYSDTLIHRMASVAAADGRPLVVLTFADADPSGWQMPISISRKLQALQVSAAHGGRLVDEAFTFRVFRVGLTVEQVQQYGLPSTPLPPSERRADDWIDRMGIQQTEVDALAALRPDTLRGLADAALRRFIDPGLDGRVRRAHRAWLRDAQAVIDAAPNRDEMDTLAAEFFRHLDSSIGE
jgi:hypothetical protein